MAKWVFAVVLALLLCSLVAGEIKTLKITSDSRSMIHFETFGFTHTGVVSIVISSVSVTSSLPQSDPSRLAFFLLSQGSFYQVADDLRRNPNLCIADSKSVTFLFNFRELSPPPLSNFNKSFTITLPNEYSLFFANCLPETQVTMDVRTELYNLDNGTIKDYLSADYQLLKG